MQDGWITYGFPGVSHDVYNLINGLLLDIWMDAEQTKNSSECVSCRFVAGKQKDKDVGNLEGGAG